MRSCTTDSICPPADEVSRTLELGSIEQDLEAAFYPSALGTILRRWVVEARRAGFTRRDFRIAFEDMAAARSQGGEDAVARLFAEWTRLMQDPYPLIHELEAAGVRGLLSRAMASSGSAPMTRLSSATSPPRARR